VEIFGRDRLAIDNNLERRMSFLCWITNTTDMRSVFLLIAFECNNCYANALQCYTFKIIASFFLFLFYFILLFYGRHHDVLVEYLKITKNTLTSSTTSFII